jgi:site-specific recombinase XerC
MLDRCGNVRLVQQALGHVSLATTQRYLRRADLDQLRKAMSA